VKRTLPFLAAAALFACRRESFVEAHTQLRFVRVPAGSFAMGSPASEAGHRADETLHRVAIARAFFLSATEVTQAQWTAVMGSNPSQFRDEANAPVERVSWLEVQEFLRRLNAMHEGRFRLPTESEWEYACRAGTTTPYAFGATLTARQANFDGKRTMRVASFAPNAWGLYDMHGNVWEWCATEYCPYPLEACGSQYKVIRGGSWYFGADSARSALRYTHEPQLRGFSIGFRVVRESDSRQPDTVSNMR
jgi:formylglycine-generating enzyme required for sulfatase activity